MEQEQSKRGGWRERKRRETLRRISESGLRLFIANGYEATTLDAIAEASGISRRTFFYYFKSKEDILLAWQSGLAEALRTALLEESTDQAPLDAVRNAHLKLVAQYNTDQAIMIERIVRSSEQLRASNQAKYLQLEMAAFESLCELWPEAGRRKSHRIVAMMSVAALRIAIESWAEAGGRGLLTEYLTQAFADLKTEVANV